MNDPTLDKVGYCFRQKNSIKFDENQMCIVFVRFLRYILTKSEYKNLNILPITLVIDNKTIKSPGLFSIVDSKCVIFINTKKVKTNKNFKSEIKSLLFTLLHEIKHYLDFTALYNTGKFNSLDECFDVFAEENDSILLFEDILDRYDFLTTYNEIPIEFAADQFAFENLSTIENLFECNSLL